MTADKKRVESKEEQTGRRRMKKCRRTVKLFIYVGIIMIGTGSFIVGTKLGMEGVKEEKQLIFVEEEVSELQVSVMEEEDSQTTEIILVNKENPLPDDYEVTLLTLPDKVNRAAIEAYDPLCAMLEAGRKEGLHFEVCSSYRDIERQRELFEEDVRLLMQSGYSYAEAYEETARETMLPGCSEHSTGLAFDIVALDYQLLDARQEKTAENIWLQEHCAEYGFILRYPKGKEDITSITYESWHFRYVGIEAARYIMENGITLEEYLEQR